MGWCDGSELASTLWLTVREQIPEDKRKRLAIKWIKIFENEGCDTMHEAQQLWLDAGHKPWWDDD